MQLNEALNLGIPIRWKMVEESDPKNASQKMVVNVPDIWAYHTPISREAFEASYRVIAATKAALFGKGLSFTVGSAPRIATLALMDAAKSEAAETEANETAGTALRAELKRLTTVFAPQASGFNSLPIDVAIGQKIINEDDWREVESAIVFFTCVYALEPRATRGATCRFQASILGASITSLSPTAFADSLQTLTPAGSSDKTASSQPS